MEVQGVSTESVNNLKLWEKRINERIESGITIREWLETNNLTRKEYYYWNRKIKDMRINGEVIFADVTEKFFKPNKHKKITQTEQYHGYELQIGKLLITIPYNFNSESLA